MTTTGSTFIQGRWIVVDAAKNPNGIQELQRRCKDVRRGSAQHTRFKKGGFANYIQQWCDSRPILCEYKHQFWSMSLGSGKYIPDVPSLFRSTGDSEPQQRRLMTPEHGFVYGGIVELWCFDFDLLVPQNHIYFPLAVPTHKQLGNICYILIHTLCSKCFCHRFWSCFNPERPKQ